MLTGSGDQRWMRKSFEERRNVYLLDSTGISDDDKEYYQIGFTDGTGTYNPLTYMIEVDPLCDSPTCIKKLVNIKKIMQLAFL